MRKAEKWALLPSVPSLGFMPVVMRSRPNKRAQGFTKHLYDRLKRPMGARQLNRPAFGSWAYEKRAKLGLHGGFDVLNKRASRWQYLTTRKACPCCGVKRGGKLVLTDKGRKYLEKVKKGTKTAF